MKKIWVVVFSVMASAALAFAQPAAESPPQEEGPGRASAQEQLKKLSGTVAQISFAQGYMVVNVDELGYIKVYVPETATISRGFEGIDISGIGLEDSVIVHYKVEDGRNTAVMIRDSTPSKKQWFE